MIHVCTFKLINEKYIKTFIGFILLMFTSSFCTICTDKCSYELVGLLLSLSLFHENSTIYIMCDSATQNSIKNMSPQPKLNIVWYIELDKYTNMNREKMEKSNLWSEFQMAKANVMKYALEYETDTLFLDSDIIITNKISDIDISKELGVSPQYIKQYHLDKTGIYNGGMLWTKNKEVPNDWIKFTKTSRYYDQASIEDLVSKYQHFKFGENYNIQCWRYYLSDESKETIAKHITSIPNDTIYYKNQSIIFVHTHFLDKRFNEFNNIIINHLHNAKQYKLLAIIFRVIHKNWIIKIPKQPLKNMGFHKNDSFREIPILLKIANKDVEITYNNNTIHCWIEPNILLYDRPTLEWCNNELNNASLLLLGNGSVDVEGKIISNKYSKLIVKPWIFWPRKPMLLEKLLTSHNLLSYTERSVESIFIGNIENNVQDKYRSNNNFTKHNWNEVISEYHCTKGTKHLFSHEEYLLKIRGAKYGLCLRGYGSKCHREVELMGWGTVPIITPDVNISSYMEPLIENIHYVYGENPEKLTEKIKLINENKWKEMSDSCHQWYMRNVHSSNCWKNMISKILYS